MSTEKLSKPVAYTDADELRFHHATSDMWPVPLGFGKDVPLYSQEYVSALTQRIAELESANQSQDDHINQQQDRIESLEKTNAGLGRRLGDAEKRLATPVALVDRRPAASGGICWQHGGKDLPHGTELFTAPPAPAVPEEMKRDPDADVFDPGFMNGWNACRAAMLAAAPEGGNDA